MMDTQERKLKALLTGQDFDAPPGYPEKLERWKLLAQSYVRIENGIAVLSDFQENRRFIYAGKFGGSIGLADACLQADSAFEEEVFGCIPAENLLDRHVLELRFFHFQKSVPVEERTGYNMVSLVHFRREGHGDIPVLHRTYYLESFPNGSIWLALCLYTPFVETGGGFTGQIVDNRTGLPVLPETYERIDRQLLSARETDVLALLAEGMGSKQIADALCISVNTVHRHRQNILAALQVNNTAAAVQIGLRLRLIPR